MNRLDANHYREALGFPSRKLTMVFKSVLVGAGAGAVASFYRLALGQAEAWSGAAYAFFRARPAMIPLLFLALALTGYAVSALAKRLMGVGPHADLGPIVHDAPIVPETKPLDDLLADLQRMRSSLAVVVDEYGRVAGIVTVEDIVEEVVGEIDDETDPAGGDVRQLPNGDWLVRGHVAVTDLHDYGVTLPVDTDAYNSVGGFVFAELGRLPQRGDTVNAAGFSIRVESVKDNRIEAVRIRPRPAGS